DRCVILPRLAGWQGWLQVKAIGGRTVLPRHRCGLMRVFVLGRLDVLGGVDAAKKDRAAAERSGFGKKPAAVNAKRSNLLFHNSSFPFIASIIEGSGTGSAAVAQRLARPARVLSAAGAQQGEV